MKIIIIGGGTSGWWTAGYLSKFGKDLDITVIESPTIPKIGVGESVLPQTTLFLSKLGMDEKVWMKDCEAVYKLGNMKQGWHRKDDKPFLFSFWWNYAENALGRSMSFRPGPSILWNHRNSARIGDYWLAMRNAGEKTNEDFVPDLSDSYALTQNMSKPFDQEGNPVLGNWAPYSYHINAFKAGEVVRDNCAIPNGVKNILADVVDVVEQDGKIVSIKLDDGKEHTADLWVDCSGFRRLLMSKLDLEVKRYEHIRTNSAVVAPFPYDDVTKELEPYTQSIARPYGWQFIVTLTGRAGSGYVFDRRLLDPEQAKKDLLSFWPGKTPAIEPRLITWDPSRLVKPWKNNVVCIGLSAFFMDPLEANGVYGIEYGVETLFRVLDKNNYVVNDYASELYSRTVGRQLDYMSEYITHHYMHTDRDDTEFWRYYKNLAKETNAEEKLWELYMSRDNPKHHLFPDAIWLSLAVYFDKFKDKEFTNLKPHMFEHVKNHIQFTRTHSEISASICKKVWE